MARCEICNKSVAFGNKISITRSHTSRRTTRTVKTLVDGQPKKISVCAKCLRSGKVTRV